MAYALSGTVRLPDESPVEGATIIVVRQSTNEVRTATTDESGAWSVGGLDNAVYDAYVRVDGKTAPAMTGVVPTEVAVAPTITITTPVEPLEVGQTRQLAVSVTGSPTPTVTYQSDDTDVATVSASGLITAVAEGECTVTATATNSEGSDSDTYALEVTEADEPPGGDEFFVSDLSGTPNGTKLEEVAPSIGDGWVKHANSEFDVVVTNGRAHASGASVQYSLYVADCEPSSADYYAEVAFRYPGGFDPAGPCLGLSGAGSGQRDRYQAICAPGDQEVRLERVFGTGAIGVMSTASNITLDEGTDHTLRLERVISGGFPSLRVLLDDVEVIGPIVHDNGDEITAAGLPGIATTSRSSALGPQIAKVTAGAL